MFDIVGTATSDVLALAALELLTERYVNNKPSHILSTHFINTPYQHTHQPTHYQHTLSTHLINTPYHHTLSTHPINTPYQ